LESHLKFVHQLCKICPPYYWANLIVKLYTGKLYYFKTIIFHGIANINLSLSLINFCLNNPYDHLVSLRLETNNWSSKRLSCYKQSEYTELRCFISEKCKSVGIKAEILWKFAYVPILKLYQKRVSYINSCIICSFHICNFHFYCIQLQVETIRWSQSRSAAADN